MPTTALCARLVQTSHHITHTTSHHMPQLHHRALAKLGATLVTYPLLVIKSRMQVGACAAVLLLLRLRLWWQPLLIGAAAAAGLHLLLLLPCLSV